MMDKNEYLAKVATANAWMSAYYEADEPLASDEEYDALIREIRAFEGANPHLIIAESPTQNIAPKVQSEFYKLAHRAKMWSMEDVFDEAELRAWAVRAKCENDFFVEPKFDGASLNLTYENGELISGATRGDGEIGEDVTLNVRTISSIPKRINYAKRIEIRGEVVILKADFDALNEARKRAGQSTFANPRNAASGSLRVLDTKITKERNLMFYPWGVGENDLHFAKHSEVMEFVRSLGFLKDDFVGVCENLDGVLNAYSALLSQRESKKMMMDGMVVRVNDLKKCAELGHTIKFPKFMAAFKFPALEKTTRLISVNLQVGRSGVITPVAEVESVEIEGAKVRFATLHNFDEIARLGVKIGDFVSIIRSGDVIPKITKIYANRRSGDEREISRPTKCPICQSEVADLGTFIKCQNLNCPARVVGEITHFVSKKCLNIDGFGEKIVQFLFDAGKIRAPRDIFFLSEADFAGLEGFKERKISNLLGAIKNARKTPLHRFINALGIEHIGEVAAKKIARKFGARWVERGFADFLAIDGFGAEMAKSVAEFLRVNKSRVVEFYEILDFAEFSENFAEFGVKIVEFAESRVKIAESNASFAEFAESSANAESNAKIVEFAESNAKTSTAEGNSKNSPSIAEIKSTCPPSLAEGVRGWVSKSPADSANFEGKPNLDSADFCHFGEKSQKNTSAIAGKIFVITGTLSRPRDEFVEIIERLGGRVSSAISSKTHFLLCGANAGSKLTKARTLGVKCIDESEFFEMIK
ncbi:NAD-dependent DNA ligase LigA [Helicobacter sp. 23-1045]